MKTAGDGKLAGFRWLALDSSTSNLTIAILEEDTLLAESHSASQRNHSIRLMPAMAELLQSLDMQPADIQGIAAGQGPGSYTGVRIAATAAKSMAWALHLPLIGVSSLAALAHGAVRRGAGQWAGPQWLIPLMNARRGQVYTGLYADDDGHSECQEQDGIRLMSQWMDQLSDRLAKLESPPERVVFVGEVEPFVDLIESLRQRWSNGVKNVCRSEQLISAYDVGILARARYLRGERDPIHAFGPNYTQLAEAEKKWLAART